MWHVEVSIFGYKPTSFFQSTFLYYLFPIKISLKIMFRISRTLILNAFCPWAACITKGRHFLNLVTTLHACLNGNYERAAYFGADEQDQQKLILLTFFSTGPHIYWVFQHQIMSHISHHTPPFLQAASSIFLSTYLWLDLCFYNFSFLVFHSFMMNNNILEYCYGALYYAVNEYRLFLFCFLFLL